MYNNNNNDKRERERERERGREIERVRERMTRERVTDIESLTKLPECNYS